LLYLVTQMRTTVNRPWVGNLGTFGNGVRKSFQGSRRIKDEIGPESSKSGAGKSDLHQTAELDAQVPGRATEKGFQEIWSGRRCRWPRMRPRVWSTEALQRAVRVNVTCVTPLGEEVASTW
jgi:hypothetical protein